MSRYLIPSIYDDENTNNGNCSISYNMTMHYFIIIMDELHQDHICTLFVVSRCCGRSMLLCDFGEF